MKGQGKQISLFTMPDFRKNLPSSKEDVSLEEPIKDHQHSQESLHEMNIVSKKIELLNLNGFKRI